MPDVVNTVVCAPDDGWRYHPKHVEQFPEINKLRKVASFWIYIYLNVFISPCRVADIFCTILTKTWNVSERVL